MSGILPLAIAASALFWLFQLYGFFDRRGGGHTLLKTLTASVVAAGLAYVIYLMVIRG